MKAKKIKIDTITTMHSIKLKLYYIMSYLPTIGNVKGNIQMTSYCTINNNESKKD